MKLGIGCDEAGYQLKEILKNYLQEGDHEVIDHGVKDGETVPYPDVAIAVARKVAAGEYERAVLICGTGIGVSISANKVKGVRAAQAHDTYSAERAQKSNNAQIVCLGARVVGPELAKSIVGAFMASQFVDGPSTPKVQRIIAFEAETQG